MDKNGSLIELAESPRTDLGRVAFAEQVDAQKVFTAIWELESQVNSGGFDRYFRYTDSDVISYAPVALGAIGANACCTLVANALQLVGPLPQTRQARANMLDGLSEDRIDKLEALDNDFYEYPDDLTELLYTFVANRPEIFGSLA